jgi:hypothetical protein
MALGYLKLAADKDLAVAKKVLGEFYVEGKYFPKDTLRGNQLLRDADRQ